MDRFTLRRQLFSITNSKQIYLWKKKKEIDVVCKNSLRFIVGYDFIIPLHSFFIFFLFFLYLCIFGTLIVFIDKHELEKVSESFKCSQSIDG